MNLHDPVLHTHGLVDRLVKVLGLDAAHAAEVERAVRAHYEAHRTVTFHWKLPERTRPGPLREDLDAASVQVRVATLAFAQGELVSIVGFDGLTVWTAWASTA